RRNSQTEVSYNKRYGDNWDPMKESELRKAFNSDLSGPELDLVNALADHDLVKADAARIAVEKNSYVYADDSVINGVLEDQYNRALENEKRDGTMAMRALDEQARLEGW